jgi:hypothetical protein
MRPPLFRLFLTAASATAFGGAQFSIKKPSLPTVSPPATRTTYGAFEYYCLKATPPGLRDVNIQSIYDIENVTDQNLNELRNAGVHLTTAMRNLQLEHKAELDDLDLQIDSLDGLIGSLKGQIEGLKKEKECNKLAVRFLNHYITGALKLELYDQRKPEWLQSNEEKLVVSDYKNDDVDEELFKKCFAKHGFEYIDYGYIMRPNTYTGDISVDMSVDISVEVQFAILGTSEESGGTEAII